MPFEYNNKNKTSIFNTFNIFLLINFTVLNKSINLQFGGIKKVVTPH